MGADIDMAVVVIIGMAIMAIMGRTTTMVVWGLYKGLAAICAVCGAAPPTGRGAGDGLRWPKEKRKELAGF
jgi:hypothetical protein